MSFPSGLVLAVALSILPAERPAVTSVVYDQLSTGQRFEISTGDSLLRGKLIDPSTGECLLSTTSRDRQFGPEQRAWLLGATHGPQAGGGGLTLVLMHQIKVGMPLEIGHGDLEQANRELTAPVTSIRLLPSEQ